MRGYRPPQSRLYAELDERNLARQGFGWLASSGQSLRTRRPKLENGIVKIPVAWDDYPMFRNGMPYEQWESQLLDQVEGEEFVTVGLHDCYGATWLPRYAELLGKLQEIGTLLTLDDVADRVAAG